MFTAYRNTFFTTATILHWYPLLEKKEYKDILINSFRFCVDQQRAIIYAFVIMENHFHVVWEILEPFTLMKVRQNMLKFTAQKILADLVDHNQEEILNKFLVRHQDRHFQIWKKNPHSFEIFTQEVFHQKIKYIHSNRWNLGNGEMDSEYLYSSAKYYETGIRDWDFLFEYT